MQLFRSRIIMPKLEQSNQLAGQEWHVLQAVGA
jgi:hypothetical protein